MPLAMWSRVATSVSETRLPDFLCFEQVRVYLRNIEEGLPAFKQAWDAWVDSSSLPVGDSNLYSCTLRVLHVCASKKSVR